MYLLKPPSASEILKVMPTDKCISDIYTKISRQNKPQNSMPIWSDAVIWNELNRSDYFSALWD